jgi:hypothetical protein
MVRQKYWKNVVLHCHFVHHKSHANYLKSESEKSCWLIALAVPQTVQRNFDIRYMGFIDNIRVYQRIWRAFDKNLEIVLQGNSPSAWSYCIFQVSVRTEENHESWEIWLYSYTMKEQNCACLLVILHCVYQHLVTWSKCSQLQCITSFHFKIDVCM